MNKKILLLLMCLITFGFANNNSDNIEAHITFGDAWENDKNDKGKIKRKKISLSKICPHLIQENGNNNDNKNTSAIEYCQINDFSFDDNLIFFQRYKSKEELKIATSNAVVRNVSGGISQKINMYELLDSTTSCNNSTSNDEVNLNDLENCSDISDKNNLKNLMSIIKGDRANETGEVYPLKVDKINFLAYSAKKGVTNTQGGDEDDGVSDKKAPVLGFIRLRKTFDIYNNDKNPQSDYSNNQIAKILGTTEVAKNEDLSYKTQSEKNGKFENLDFYTIGKTINDWLDYEFKNDTTNFNSIKSAFESISVEDTNKSWSRVMSGVAVLDDSYIERLDSKGEIVLRDDNIAKLENTSSFNGVLEGLYGIDNQNNGKNIFDKINDKKLWGFYLYLSKNLHELEILLILGLAGGTFTFVTGWKGFNYFRQLKTEQKDPLDWKKMIMQPITYTLLVATPLVPTDITIDSDDGTRDFIINKDISESSIIIDGFSTSNSKSFGANKEDNRFYQTPLQSLIQGAVSFGAEMADHFSRATTFSFATFIGFREQLNEDHTDFVNGLASEYADLSKRLIELSAIQRMYLSTCRLDYSYSRNDDLKKEFAHIYPTPINSFTQNDAQQAESIYKSMIDFKIDEANFSVSACQKFENWLYHNSKSTIKDLFEFHQRFTGHYNSFYKACTIRDNNNKVCKVEFDEKDKKEDLMKKIKKLAFYERTFGWVNVAMLPLLYQTMYPSFDPYYYKEKTQETNTGTENTEISTSNFSDHYVLIGAPTMFQDVETFSLKKTDEKGKFNTENGGYQNMLENYLVSTISYSLMPGYNEIEAKLKTLYNKMSCKEYDMHKQVCLDSKINTDTITILRFIKILSDKTLRKSGSFEFGKEISQSSLENVLKQGIKNDAQNVSKKIKNKKFADVVTRIIDNNNGKIKILLEEALIKTTAQSLYIYILNIVVMMVLTMILVFKIGMYFVQAIVFYVASPLIIVWAMITKKEDQIKNYVGKSLILIFTPILIVLSGAILILAVGVIHQMYFIIVNHLMSIQIPEVYLSDAESFFAQVSTYIQMQTFFGIGNIVIGLAYLFLGYIILIKFSQWFFETVGIQTQSSMTQNIEGLTNRMGFSRSLGV